MIFLLLVITLVLLVFWPAIRVTLAVTALLWLTHGVFWGCPARAERVMPQCQTEESRGFQFMHDQMIKAAADADPWRGVGPGVSMSSTFVDSMEVVKRQRENEAATSLLKVRALEAAHCPQWSVEILAALPITDEEKSKVRSEYDRRLKKSWDDYLRIIRWQNDHSQCRHVENDLGGGTIYLNDSCTTPPPKKEDLSGNASGRKGWCVVSDGKLVAGSDEDISSFNPESNEAIKTFACASALAASDLGDGEVRVDPKICEGGNQ